MFEDCLEEVISPELCARLARHLDACGRCRGACDTVERTLALCRASAAEVPASVQDWVRTALRACLAEDA
jgi:RNA polymerase sigma-70 factor (ECF subfamily)